jgi:hypothetical protein
MCFRRARMNINPLGLTQSRHSASQHSVFCLRQHGTSNLLVYGFSARSAEKPYSLEKEYTPLPQAKNANCVSPTLNN